MKCPSCSAENKDTAKFCKECGDRLSTTPSSVAATHSSEAIEPQVVSTPPVGATSSSKESARQAAVSIPSATDAPPIKATTTSIINNVPLLFGGGAAIIALLAGGGLLYSKLQKEGQLRAELENREQQLQMANQQARAEEDRRRREAERAKAALEEAGRTIAQPQQPSASHQEPQRLSGDRLDAPLISVGDTYTFETIDHVEPKLNNVTTREVANVSGNVVTMKYINTKSGYTRLLTYDSNLGLLSTRSRNNEGSDFRPAFKYFSFPGRVGDTWTSASTETNGKTGKTRTHAFKGRIEGVETVSVPAGTFQAWKISIESEVREGSKTTFGRDVSWYSPEVRRTVKSEIESRDGDTGKRGHRTVSLLSYSVRP